MNRSFSAASVADVRVSRIEISTFDNLTGADEIAFAHAPLLFARRNSIGRFTDIPLLMWYEVFPHEDAITIRYSFIWPEPMDLSRHSREELMDRHPWTYRIMAQELLREGKISEAGGHMIRDPRDYVYIEANAPRDNMGIDLIVGMRDGRQFDSALGRGDLRITRSGWFRVAIRVAEGESPAGAKTIRLQCMHHGQAAPCEGVGVQKSSGWIRTMCQGGLGFQRSAVGRPR